MTLMLRPIHLLTVQEGAQCCSAEFILEPSNPPRHSLQHRPTCISPIHRKRFCLHKYQLRNPVIHAGEQSVRQSVISAGFFWLYVGSQAIA